MENIFSLIVGGVIVWGIYHRIKTINTYDYIQSVRLTVAIFTSLMFGILIMNPNKVTSVISSLFNSSNPVWVFIIILFVYPVAYQCMKGYTLRYSIKITSWPIIAIIGFVILVLINGPAIKYEEIIIFVLVMPALGFIHATLGSILAAVNISLMLSAVFKQQALTIDFNTVFDFLSILGIESTPVKWTILFISTFLGLSDYLDFNKLRYKIENML